jgi:hypothetical protein
MHESESSTGLMTSKELGMAVAGRLRPEGGEQSKIRNGELPKKHEVSMRRGLMPPLTDRKPSDDVRFEEGQRRNFGKRQLEDWFKSWGSADTEVSGEAIVNMVKKSRRRPQTWEDLQEQVAFRKDLDEKLNRLREESTAGGQDEMGRQRLTLLQVLLLILAASLSAPENAAAESAKETQRQAA